MADKKALVAKYKAEIKAALDIDDERWAEDDVPSLLTRANKLAILEAKGDFDKIEAAKAEIVEAYRKYFNKDSDKEARARKREELRAEEKAAVERARAEVKAKAGVVVKSKAAVSSAEKMEKARAELAAAQKKAQEDFDKKMKALEEGKVKRGAEKLARENSAALKRAAATFEEAATRNLKAVLGDRTIYAWHKEGLAHARAAGNTGRNSTLKNIGAKNFLDKCSFCKYCRRTRRATGKTAAKKTNGNSPGRGSGNNVVAAANAAAPESEGNF
jgi:hypothetical protein